MARGRRFWVCSRLCSHCQLPHLAAHSQGPHEQPRLEMSPASKCLSCDSSAGPSSRRNRNWGQRWSLATVLWSVPTWVPQTQPLTRAHSGSWTCTCQGSVSSGEQGARKGDSQGHAHGLRKGQGLGQAASGPQELPCRPLPLAPSTPRLPWALQHLCPQVVNAGQVAHGSETPLL